MVFLAPITCGYVIYTYVFHQHGPESDAYMLIKHKYHQLVLQNAVINKKNIFSPSKIFKKNEISPSKYTLQREEIKPERLECHTLVLKSYTDHNIQNYGNQEAGSHVAI